MIAFTKSAAKELGKFGIRVNCISPGFIQNTGMSSNTPTTVSKKLFFKIEKLKFLSRKFIRARTRTRKVLL